MEPTRPLYSRMARTIVAWIAARAVVAASIATSASSINSLCACITRSVSCMTRSVASARVASKSCAFMRATRATCWAMRASAPATWCRAWRRCASSTARVSNGLSPAEEHGRKRPAAAVSVAGFVRIYKPRMTCSGAPYARLPSQPIRPVNAKATRMAIPSCGSITQSVVSVRLFLKRRYPVTKALSPKMLFKCGRVSLTPHRFRRGRKIVCGSAAIRSAAGLRQEALVDEIGFGRRLVDDADIDQRLLHGGKVLLVDMPVGEEARRLGVVDLRRDLVGELRQRLGDADRLGFVRLHEAERLEPGGEKAAQHGGPLFHHRLARIDDVSDEVVNLGAGLDQDARLALLLERERARGRADDGVDILGEQPGDDPVHRAEMGELELIGPDAVIGEDRLRDPGGEGAGRRRSDGAAFQIGDRLHRIIAAHHERDRVQVVAIGG